MQLTLITVNYRNAAATIGLLRSLEQQREKSFDVIVVDNDSGDDDRAQLGAYAATSPLQLDVIYSDTNRGFSGGNNLAIRKAMAQGSEWILLINNDTTVTPDFIEKLVAQLPDQPCVAQIPLNEGEQVAYGGIVQWLKPTLKHLYQADSEALRYVIGAGMLVHRSVFERIGLLDEAYFLYFEDADFSMRARHAGIPIHFLREPVITHRESETTKTLGSPLLLHYHARNALRFNWRNGPWWVKMATPLAAVYGIIKTRNRAMRAGVFDFLFGRWGKIDSRPVIAIECESIEHDRYGVARLINGLLRQLAADPEHASAYRYVLYFNATVPEYDFLKSPLFTTRVVGLPRWGLPSSFSLYYYAILPLWLWLTRPALTYWPNYMLPLIAPRPSLVMLTEDIAREMRNPQLPFRYRIAYRIFGTWTAWTATRVMAISHTSKTELTKQFGIAPQRIVVNELAVDEPQRAEPMEGNYVLFVGQAFPRRHLRETIKAFETIAADDPTLRLIAIGPEKYEPPILDALVSVVNARLGRPAVQRICEVSDADLARFYAGARALVYVSFVEAFGLPPVEALAYGVPAVVADTSISRELFGDAACYVRDGHVESIVAALRQALTDTAHRNYIRASAPAILARYTWSAHALRWLEIVKKLENC